MFLRFVKVAYEIPNFSHNFTHLCVSFCISDGKKSRKGYEVSPRKSKKRVASFKRSVTKHLMSNADKSAKENISTQMRHALRPLKAIEQVLRESIKVRRKETAKRKTLGAAYVQRRHFISLKSEAALRAAYDLLDKRARVIAAAASKGWAVATGYAQKIQ